MIYTRAEMNDKVRAFLENHYPGGTTPEDLEINLVWVLTPRECFPIRLALVRFDGKYLAADPMWFSTKHYKHKHVLSAMETALKGKRTRK